MDGADVTSFFVIVSLPHLLTLFQLGHTLGINKLGTPSLQRGSLNFSIPFLYTVERSIA